MAAAAETNTLEIGENRAPARLKGRTEDAFAESEREGLMLAAKVRIIAIGVIFLWQTVDNRGFDMGFFVGLVEISSFAMLGFLQYICAKQRFHMHVLKYIFVFVDCMLLAFIFSVEYPFQDYVLPPALQMHGSRFGFFFIFLMQAAFSLRTRLVLWCGLCIVMARTAMLVWFASRPGVSAQIDFPEQTVDAFLKAYTDPNFIFLGFWVTEVVVTVLLAAGLAVIVRRSMQLVEKQVAAERTRSSLARYFSPNVVDLLGDSETPLAGVREQDVAVLFADIMDFTKLCESEPPDTVIALLRDYHNRLGQAVFDNAGTLDKYIGDGLMATFGTPQASVHDARNALQCAMDMIAALEAWNSERRTSGLAPVRVGIGVHYGLVVVGDIGNERRLEYSVIGDTVNIASRLEQLTRDLGTQLVVSDTLIRAVAQATDEDKALVHKLSDAGLQKIRGREVEVPVWIIEAAGRS